MTEILTEHSAVVNTGVCRLCLNKYMDGINLTEDPNILLVFEFCFGISIDLQYPPRTLCLKCTESIKSFSNLKQKCLKSEELWKSFREVPNCSLDDVFKEEITLKNEIISTENLKCYNDNPLESQFLCDKFNDVSVDNMNAEENETEDISIKLKSNEILNENNKIKRYRCRKCKKEYSKQKWLVTHKMNFCYKSKYKKIDMDQENKYLQKTLETDQVVSSCGLCNMPYICDISKHMIDHWSINDVKCQICDFNGRDFADMITHSYKHTPKAKLQCFVCEKKKASIPSLQFHFRSVHLQKPGGICTVCDRTFQKFKTWKRHERLHDERGLFICDHCGRKFLYKHEIKSHLIHHTDARQFVCETCGKRFKRMSGLKDHIENVHSIKDPVKCSHCNKTYKSQTKLEIHLKNLTKERLCICEVCSKSFITEKMLQKHMFWHTGERPHTCEVCGSKYKAKGQLNLHMRKHTGFMPYKCSICGKSFPAAKQLKRHQSVHTGVRAHKCVLCERSFHEKKALLLHMLQHKDFNRVKPET